MLRIKLWSHCDAKWLMINFRRKIIKSFLSVLIIFCPLIWYSSLILENSFAMSPKWRERRRQESQVLYLFTRPITLYRTLPWDFLSSINFPKERQVHRSKILWSYKFHRGYSLTRRQLNALWGMTSGKIWFLPLTTCVILYQGLWFCHM